MIQPGLFDIHDRLESLSKAGDPLILLDEKIEWKKFSRILNRTTIKDRKSNAGRKPFSPLLMFKILILQSLYNLSDEQMEFMIRDRLSFMRFLELNFEDRVPDQKTIWHYRELFTNAGIIKTLFNKFNKMLVHRRRLRYSWILGFWSVYSPVIVRRHWPALSPPPHPQR